MIRSPSKHARLDTLEAAAVDNGITAGGAEYSAEELEAEIHRKRERRSARVVERKVRDLDNWAPVLDRRPPPPNFWMRLTAAVRSDRPGEVVIS